MRTDQNLFKSLMTAFARLEQDRRRRIAKATAEAIRSRREKNAGDRKGGPK
jgi:hypothetical protein